MYSQAQQTGAEGAAGAAEEPVGEKPASEVEEADFEIVDEDENNK